ncbi:hypothetical protein [uncultured Psychrosphaera sp.]|uniref:hypothetical protein n=1 Tax=uncultured Psychrosphaera sp. TaxID=1403522 RepID=UPI0030FAFE3F
MTKILTISLLLSLTLNIYLINSRTESIQTVDKQQVTKNISSPKTEKNKRTNSIEEVTNSHLDNAPSSPVIINENEIDISSEVSRIEQSTGENEHYIEELRSVLPSHFEGDILGFMMNTSVSDLEKIIHLLEDYHGVTERSASAELKLNDYFTNNSDKFELLDYSVYCSGSGCYIKYSAPTNSDISSDIILSSAYSSQDGAFGTQFKKDDGTVDYIDFIFFNTDM